MTPERGSCSNPCRGSGTNLLDPQHKPLARLSPTRESGPTTNKENDTHVALKTGPPGPGVSQMTGLYIAFMAVMIILLAIEYASQFVDPGKHRGQVDASPTADSDAFGPKPHDGRHRPRTGTPIEPPDPDEVAA